MQNQNPTVLLGSTWQRTTSYKFPKTAATTYQRLPWWTRTILKDCKELISLNAATRAQALRSERRYRVYRNKDHSYARKKRQSSYLGDVFFSPDFDYSDEGYHQ